MLELVFGSPIPGTFESGYTFPSSLSQSERLLFDAPSGDILTIRRESIYTLLAAVRNTQMADIAILSSTLSI